MIKITFFNNDDVFVNKFKALDDVEIEYADIREMESKAKIGKDNSLYEDYLRLLYAREHEGLNIFSKCELVGEMRQVLTNNFFMGFDTENTISSSLIYVKEKDNVYINKAIEIIENENVDNITEVMSKAVGVNLSKIYTSLVKLDNNSFIYPYDYFFPLDYEKHGKRFSENTKLVMYKDEPMSKKVKRKLNSFKKYGGAATVYFNSLIDTWRVNIGRKKYNFMLKAGIATDKKAAKDQIEETINVLSKYEKNIDYIIIHNPNWMGVTSATKELFTNLVPLQELNSNSEVEKVCSKILELNPKQVIFSAFVDGWEKLARELRKRNPQIKLKSFWHGSHSQVVDEINWRTNTHVIELHKEGVIDVMGTCKESLLNFYLSQGYKAAFLKNTVRLDDELLKEVEESKKLNKSKNIKIGLYAAGLDWRKNMYTQMAAASLYDNAIIDSLPLSYESEVFMSKFKIGLDGKTKGVPRNELLKRMAQNDVNLYVTFSECAPMLPIESMEVGTLCVSGNNHHYFKNTPLEEYLIVNREDDVIAIKEKVDYALKNKDKIFELYKAWKEDYDKSSAESIEEFLKM
ncbi:MAG: hypothetical protein IKD74_00565 [Clostridia bacterium]|nr:hypothetical protein [Clostridia bacterium]